VHIIEVSTGELIEIEISEVVEKDFEIIDEEKYFFDWNEYKGSHKVYKLMISKEPQILGLMALREFQNEYRVEVSLIACSRENYSQSKRYDKIAGCLLAFACREAIKTYGYMAAVSLKPKTVLKEHYQRKYGMKSAGISLFLEGEGMLNLINEYSV